jgi:class 3 adenylate cyclase
MIYFKGDAIGGIMGTDIVRYDIYGKDVLIANKMESYGELGKIQISEKTKELMEIKFKDVYNFTFNKTISI